LPKRNLDWIRETPEEILTPDILSEDAQLVLKRCGLDVFIALWSNLVGLNIYVSGEPIRRAQKAYIKTFYNGRNVKDLALRSGVSERFVYQVVRSMRKRVRVKG